MNKKTKIIILTIIVILFCITTIILVYVKNNSSEKYYLENIITEYNDLNESVVAKVNDEPITNKDLCLIKYSCRPQNPVKEAIRQKSIALLAEEDGFSLSQEKIDKEVKYIDKAYDKLNLPETEQNIAFKSDLRNNHLEMSTSISYETYIEKQILNQEFKTSNKKINKKYEKFKSLYKKWEDTDKKDSKLFKKIWLLMDEITEDYIDDRIKEFKVEKY